MHNNSEEGMGDGVAMSWGYGCGVYGEGMGMGIGMGMGMGMGEGMGEGREEGIWVSIETKYKQHGSLTFKSVIIFINLLRCIYV